MLGRNYLRIVDIVEVHHDGCRVNDVPTEHNFSVELAYHSP